MKGIFAASREAALEAMRSTGREAAMRELWGEGFDSLFDYIALACAPTSVGLDALRDSIEQHPVRKTMVLTGERCSGADLEHGTDSPILRGLVPVMELLAPVSCLVSKERNGREPNALSLIISGGVTLTPEMGEITGDVMAAQFNAMTNGIYRDVSGGDSFTMNTGDQARVLAGILFARRIERVVFAHVIDHIARFGATVMAALKQLVDAENAQLYAALREYTGDEHKETRERIQAARRKMPEIVFVALGDWSDRDPRRGRDNGGAGISRAREAFGPVQSADEEMFEKKRLGCEYAERYYAEQDPIKSIGYACPALTPKNMIHLLTSS